MPISIKKININVSKSQAYKDPLIFLWHDALSPMCLKLNNEGNSSITEIEVTHYFSNNKEVKDYKNKYYKKFTYSPNDKINAEDEGNSAALNFSESLKSEGVDVNFLTSDSIVDFYNNPSNDQESAELKEKIIKALGKYTEGYDSSVKINRTKFSAFIYGTMKIKGIYENNAVEKTIDFEGEIALTSPYFNYGDLFAGSAYDVKLRDNGENYTISLETSKYLKPFEAEKFLLRMLSTQSGFHSLSIDVIFSDDTYTKSNEISFFNWSPRTKREGLMGISKNPPLPKVIECLNDHF